MAPDDRPVLPLASLVDSLLEESEVSVLVVVGAVESEPVVAVVASVDAGGCCFNQPKNLSRAVSSRITYRSVESRVHLIVDLSNAAHHPMLSKLFPLQVGAHEDRTIRDAVEIPAFANINICDTVCIA
jgi:hypothetical protein